MCGKGRGDYFIQCPPLSQSARVSLKGKEWCPMPAAHQAFLGLSHSQRPHFNKLALSWGFPFPLSLPHQMIKFSIKNKNISPRAEFLPIYDSLLEKVCTLAPLSHFISFLTCSRQGALCTGPQGSRLPTNSPVLLVTPL